MDPLAWLLVIYGVSVIGCCLIGLSIKPGPSHTYKDAVLIVLPVLNTLVLGIALVIAARTAADEWLDKL